MRRARSHFGRWLQALMDSDTRYICRACDDRFSCHIEGVEHVLRSHPEFASFTLEPDTPGPPLLPTPLLG